MALDKSAQYLRKCTLVVFGNEENVDLSQFRIRFSVKRTNEQTPNTASIRVYNLGTETAQTIKKEYSRVLLQAGYDGNFGVIFQGNIMQVLIGRESGTDTYLDILSGDGDMAYNYAIVKKSIAKGSNLRTQLLTVAEPMKDFGVTLGHYDFSEDLKLPRGKVFWGSSENYLKELALTSSQSWSIQDEKIQFVPLKSYLPGEAVELTSFTGLIGSPQQTNVGVNLKCLLNPLIVPGGRVKLNNDSIQGLQLNPNAQTAAQINQSIPSLLTADGVYVVLLTEHQGDTRGQAWYTNIVTLVIDPTVSPDQSVVPYEP